MTNQQSEKKTNKFKKHLQAHKGKYIAGAAGLAVGAVGTLAVKKYGGDVVVIINDALNIKLWSPTHNDIYVDMKGHPGNVIEDLKTGIFYGSERDASKGMHISRTSLKKRLLEGSVKNHGMNIGESVIKT